MTFSIFAFPRRRCGVAEMHDTTRPGISQHWKRSVDIHLHGFSLFPDGSSPCCPDPVPGLPSRVELHFAHGCPVQSQL
jgi:hypothetical protein